MFLKIFKIVVALSIAFRCFGQEAGDKKASSSDVNVDLSKIFYEPTLDKKQPVQPAKSTPAKIFHLGLKYRATLCTQQCDIQDVNTSREFHSGDRIRFYFSANADGYLYVLHKGSSGDENLLFPNSGLNGGNNKIRKNVIYPVPPDTWFVFDQNPGEEHLKVILSRHPLESLPQQASSEASTPLGGKEQRFSLAQVDQELSRKVNARDLGLFTEPSPVTKGGASSVQSTIVVNTNSSEDKNQVVYKDIVLRHTSSATAVQSKDMSARDLYLEGSQKTAEPLGEAPAAPLGLSYSVLKQQNGQFVKVDPQGNFHSGDVIRLRIEVNDSGFLYVIHRDPDGIWNPLFPPGNAAEGNNAVKKNETYEIPGAGDRYRWVFDSQPGIEKLFIVLSRQRQSSFDVLLKSVNKRPDERLAKSDTSRKRPDADKGSIEMVSDALVAQMDEKYSRGIKMEFVEEKESATSSVPVAYAVNPSGAPDSIVVTEVSLTHK